MFVLQTDNGDTQDIIKAILKCHELYKSDAKEIARNFKKSDFEKTCKAVYDYVFSTVKYELDKDGIQIAKRAQTTLRLQKADCKGISLLVGSILNCLGIDFSFRFASYSPLRDYSHIYVVATNGTKEIIIDPVWGTYNREKPTSRTKDYLMKTKVYIGTTFNILSDSELIAKYYPSVESGLNRLLVILKNISVPEKYKLALIFANQIKADAKKDMKRLLFYNSYSNRFLAGSYNWTQYNNALTTIFVMADTTAVSGIGNVFDDFGDQVKQIGDSLGDTRFFRKLKQLKNWSGEQLNSFADAAKVAAAKVQENIDKVGGRVEAFADWNREGFTSLVNDPKKFVSTEANSLRENAQEAWDKIKTLSLAPMRAAFLQLVIINPWGLADQINNSDQNVSGEKWHSLGGDRDKLFSTAKLAILKQNQDIKGIGSAEGTAALVAAAGTVLAAMTTALSEARKLKEGAENLQSGLDNLKQDILKEFPEANKYFGDANKLKEQQDELLKLGGELNKADNTKTILLVGGMAIGFAGLAYLATREKKN